MIIKEESIKNIENHGYERKKYKKGNSSYGKSKDKLSKVKKNTVFLILKIILFR